MKHLLCQILISHFGEYKFNLDINKRQHKLLQHPLHEHYFVLNNIEESAHIIFLY
jgi:hypothetical protein